MSNYIQPQNAFHQCAISAARSGSHDFDADIHLRPNGVTPRGGAQLSTWMPKTESAEYQDLGGIAS